jgi:hypothetical protein
MGRSEAIVQQQEMFARVIAAGQQLEREKARRSNPHDKPEGGHSRYNAGILHQSQLAMIARGPWRYEGMKPTRYVTEHTASGPVDVAAAGGTCDICGQGIIDVTIWKSAAGERATLGVDCAKTLEKNMAAGSGRRFDADTTKRNKEKRASAKVRKGARNEEKHAALLAELTAFVADGREDYPGNFARSLARQIREGKTPSEKQLGAWGGMKGRAFVAPRAARPDPREQWGEMLQQLDWMHRKSEGWTHAFTGSLADQIRAGRTPSAKQIAAYEKLLKEWNAFLDGR